KDANRRPRDPGDAPGMFGGRDREEQLAKKAMNQEINLRAMQLLAGLYDVLARKEDVHDYLKADESIPEAVRREALNLWKTTEPSARRRNDASWFIVRRPNAPREHYRRAFLLAEEANRQEPESGFYLNTLGVAYYRLGQYAKAAETLGHSDAINS